MPTRLWLSLVLLGGCAKHHAISGTVVDRNGRPLDHVIVAMHPGGVELITDSEGQFTIDYLRDERGGRTRLETRTEYEIQLLKPGFHEESTRFRYTRGDLSLPPLTLIEETLKVDASDDDLDPNTYGQRANSDGSNYEGE